ncbi:BadF/BadG/BcrA/BcrD ATPase family protein [Vibrio anguillarum]|uniref:BadF/BadG/BcrA/BcrD ATPase family protein n=1 Tax=Vibrio anguillarum TaxID=55601 RepID=UPI00359401C8
MTFYYVGIDGGGTSCRARIRNEQGALLGEAKSGSANILLGVELAMQTIIDAITQTAHQSGLTKENFAQMHVGLALAGAEQKSAWHAFMSQTHPFASLTLNTDAYGACIGAHNGEDGIGEPSSLSAHVMQHFNHDVDQIVEWSKNALPRDYGQFSPVIFSLAQQGDVLAIELLKQTAADIEMFLVALHNKGAKRICLMGSIAERILYWLSPPVQQWIVQPQFDAIEGAIMFAGKAEHNLY